MLKTLTLPRRRSRLIGPDDNGRRMSLAEFDRIDGREGFLYELNKGIVEVHEFPDRHHLRVLSAIRFQLICYQLANRKYVHAVGDSANTKLLIESEQSERHPDISVYTSPMPDVDEIWSIWVPAIAVEVVSESSAQRDYQDKPAEYLAFGISEYWIVDGFKRQMTVMTRYRGVWKSKIVRPTQKHTTRHLPGFRLDLKGVLSDSK
jgi:Uma2 family endonuclease